MKFFNRNIVACLLLQLAALLPVALAPNPFRCLGCTSTPAPPSEPQSRYTIQQWPGLPPDTSKFEVQLRDRFRFHHLKLDDFRPYPLDHDQLIEQIQRNPDEKRFVQVGEYSRDMIHMQFAMPIDRIYDGDVPNEKFFAWIGLHNGWFDKDKRRVWLYGYTKAKNVEGIAEALRTVRTDHMGDFDVGKVMSLNQIFELLKEHGM